MTAVITSPIIIELPANAFNADENNEVKIRMKKMAQENFEVFWMDSPNEAVTGLSLTTISYVIKDNLTVKYITKIRAIMIKSPASGKTIKPTVKPINMHANITAAMSRLAPTILGMYFHADFSEFAKSSFLLMLTTTAPSKYEPSIAQIISEERMIIKNKLNSSGVNAFRNDVPSESLFVPESKSACRLELVVCLKISHKGSDSKI